MRVLPSDIEVVGRLADDHERRPVHPPLLGVLRDAERVIRELVVTDVVVDRTSLSKELVRTLLSARLSGVRICTLADFFQSTAGQIPLECLTDHSLLFSDGFGFLRRPIVRRLKRLGDVFLSILVLVSGAPLMLLISLAIKLTSRGPVFFRQKRVGKNEELFELVKFRSMAVDGGEARARWADVNDPRITPVGRWLRRFHLDELPQVYNVLRGRMSFIGPRPEQPQFVELLKEVPYYTLRHCLLPGITGWAQVNYPYANCVDSSKDKLAYDLYYVKNVSFSLDVLIVLKTVRALLHPPIRTKSVETGERLPACQS
jgi:exopolysaccharide biosynthesis polyprenyl glycosylphosphotransferase